jgi:5-formyltetrahydrofolate cyclo-ligase
MTLKKEIRARIQEQLHKLPLEKYEELSKKLCEKVLNEPSIIEGNTIAVTISNYPEVNTRFFIETLWQQGKKVVVPKCHPATREMTFYAITSFEQLEVAYAQIQEPIVQVCEVVQKEEIDVCIVPGIVFDQRGYRIGFGGGYYDRFLKDFEQPTLSLAFDIQFVKEVPVNKYDQKIKQLVLQNTVLSFE